MDIDGIADFIMLAECRSFSKAAQARFVTQPAFSRRIKSLEERMDATLVDRSVTPIALTEAGEIFLVHARGMMDLLDKAEDEIQAQTTTLENPVRIMMPAAAAVTFFPAWYKDLQKNVNDLKVKISTRSSSKSILNLRKGSADLAIIIRSPKIDTCYNLEGLKPLILGKDMIIAVRARHAKKTIDNLLVYPYRSHMQECAEEVMKRNKKKLAPVFETSSVELLRSMCLAGFGTAILQESLIEDDLREGFLVPAFELNKKLSCDIVLIRPSGRIQPNAEALWQHCQKMTGGWHQPCCKS